MHRGVLKHATRRILVEMAVVVAAAVCVTLVFYSHWFGDCCQRAADSLFVFFAPGILMGAALGGGWHSATRAHAGIGIVIEFLVLWAIVRLLIRVTRRRHPE